MASINILGTNKNMSYLGNNKIIIMEAWKKQMPSSHNIY